MPCFSERAAVSLLWRKPNNKNPRIKEDGCSVTQRIKQIKQPRGGYINPRTLEVAPLGEGADVLNPEENVSPGLIGSAVDYLTRFMLGESVDIVFEISMFGAQVIGEVTKAWDLMVDIEGLDDRSIINAVKFHDLASSTQHNRDPIKNSSPTPPHSLLSVCRHTALREGRGRGAAVLLWLFSLRTRSIRGHFGNIP